MSDALNRRDFLASTAGVAAAAALPFPTAGTAFPAPAVHLRPPAKPVAISSANSLDPVTKAAEAVAQGADTLDAAVEGVKIQELDPSDHSVGYGGLPNMDGVVQLDASCIHGPSKRAG
ncbi:MAG TPA: isoaspartyl peptidase/L-asparaginase, partial [Gemmatimonadales bacterium]|nr:isoaspartyl peptidase/L-asparaginase [Gemmatimonadales bacterium]